MAQVDRPHQLFSDAPAVAGSTANITSSTINTTAQPPTALPPIPPIPGQLSGIGMMPLPAMPPINPLYYANPDDPSAMINLMHWQQNAALANPLAFNGLQQPPMNWPPIPPPPSANLPVMPPPIING